jgi:hypothetical protein
MRTEGRLPPFWILASEFWIPRPRLLSAELLA